jgi:FMN-dependent oxidoreductase (nitrilotriacetate monooxygenase family)
MSRRTLKLGAVLLGVGGPGQHETWLSPEIPGDASVDIRWYIARAQQAEAAKFDHVFIVDSQFITPDSPNHYLNRLEPLTLLSAVAVHTTHIGLVGTLTTSYNDPFNVARRLASLDLISGGRAGWNVVATGDGGTAGNYGRAEHYDYAARYGRALEHVRVVQGLWDSYEDDAFPRDKQNGVFFDRSRQHALNHVGEHFSVVGPLNIERSAQGRPVIFQAGDSNEGRDLGASIAEAIFTHAQTIEQGRAFALDIRARAEAKGRNPQDILIVPGISPIVADTDEEARAKEQQSLDSKVGSPLTVANEIQRWFEAGAFDGVNITVTEPSEFARFIDDVLPILRERGVVRSEYESSTLRGNLGLPIPENVHTAARHADEEPVPQDAALAR